MTYHGDGTLISDAKQRTVGPEQRGPRPRLLDEIRSRLRLKHYSLKTERAYLYWIRRYIHANGRRHPRELDGVALKLFFPVVMTGGKIALCRQCA